MSKTLEERVAALELAFADHIRYHEQHAPTMLRTPEPPPCTPTYTEMESLLDAKEEHKYPLPANIERGESVTIERDSRLGPRGNLHGKPPFPTRENPLGKVLERLTTDPNDPRLGHGGDDKPQPQNEVYLVLSEEERAKGFVRPVRMSYKHVGLSPKYPMRDLTPEEQERHADMGYVKYEPYPEADHPSLGRYWTQRQLDRRGCGTVTTMGPAIAETYARQPHFYGATYCCMCSKHLPVEEFVWEGTSERVGS